MVYSASHPIDLHTHTTASDGTVSPGALVGLAARLPLSAVAVTDHDTTDGLDEALLAGERLGVEVVPGVELSIGGSESMHILGLLIDHKSASLVKTLETLRAAKEERNKKVIARLREMGYDISYEEVQSLCGGENMGRLHIAKWLLGKGCGRDVSQLFRSLLSPGRPAYVPREKLGEKEGIEAIKKAGGIPVLAHINYFHKTEDELSAIVERLVGCGLMGIEVLYPDYDPAAERTAGTLAARFGLLRSGGTDFHGANRPQIRLGTGKGNLSVPSSYLTDLKQAKPTAP